MGTGGDKIVLLDGAGAGSGTANGLLSMIPGMFANMMGGSKMDPNLIAALMNGKNNQDAWGGGSCWWLWIIVLFWLWQGNGWGNNRGNNDGGGIQALPNQLNNDYGRELLMQAINGNRGAIESIASTLNCSTQQLQSAICNLQGGIDKVAGQVGMSGQQVINAVQQLGCEIGNQIATCCCNLQNSITNGFNGVQHALDTMSCNFQNTITRQGYENQIATSNQTNILQNAMLNGFNNLNQSNQAGFNMLANRIDQQTTLINDKFCWLEKARMQDRIDQLAAEKAALETAAITQAQTANIVGQLRPQAPVPAYIVGNPNCCYTPTVQVTAAPQCGCATAQGTVI